MRISTNGAFRNGLGLMQELQAALDRTQRQIASGRRLLTPSDDPIASGRALEFKEAVSRIGQFERNATIAENRLGFEESALKSAGDILQRVRELSIQASNATQSNESRALIAVELRQQLDALVQVANQQDGNGRYLFAGNKDDTRPVSRSGTGFVYNGDEGQRRLQVAETRQIADGDSGADVFFRIRNGNGTFTSSALPGNTGSGVLASGNVIDAAVYDRDTYTIRFVDADNYEVVDSASNTVASGPFDPAESIAFQGIEINLGGQPASGDQFEVAPSDYTNMFAMVENLADAVATTVNDDVSNAAMRSAINNGILGLDQALGTTLAIRTKVGSRLSAIETQADSNSAALATLQESIADIEDLDYAAAISRLSIEAATLEAAQKSFIRIQGLSLFNVL